MIAFKVIKITHVLTILDKQFLKIEAYLVMVWILKLFLRGDFVCREGTELV